MLREFIEREGPFFGPGNARLERLTPMLDDLYAVLGVTDDVDEATTLLQDRLVAMWQELEKRHDTPKWWFLERRIAQPPAAPRPAHK